MSGLLHAPSLLALQGPAGSNPTFGKQPKSFGVSSLLQNEMSLNIKMK